MGLGLNITSGDGAGYTPHIRNDARSGRWVRADRSQGADGRWSTELVDISQPPPTFIMDLARIEVGWISYSNGGPDLRMVPAGQTLPPQPSPEHKQGFRVRVYAPKLLGGVREFASCAKVVIAAMEPLHDAFQAAPESAQGLVPVVTVAGTTPVTTRTPQGSTTNYAPVFEIEKWVQRPAELEPTAAAGGTAPTASPPAGSVSPASAQQATAVAPPPAPAAAPAAAPVAADATEF